MTKYYLSQAEVNNGEYDKLGLDDVLVTASSNRQWLDVDTNISVRSSFGRRDYEYYREGEIVPDKPQDIIKLAMKIYDRVSIVNNVINLMGDFGCKGIKLQHPVPAIQRFYNKWFELVKGKERSERFLNLLYRCGNVFVKRTNGKIKSSEIQKWKKVIAEENKGEIPIKYTFLNPLSIEVDGENLATFLGKPLYSLKLNDNLISELKEINRLYNGQFNMEDMPEDIRNAIKNRKTKIVLDQTKLHVYHFKKDDWSVWANPITYCIMDDLINLEKLKLADQAALDGAISNIRLWNLGYIDPSNPQNNIFPTKALINKLRNIIANNPGGGTIDLVWGPELKFSESNTQVHRFLGSEKYEVVLNSIYDGLGVPSTLRNNSGSNTGTGNFLALKTLIERLQYGRDLLIQFWTDQIALIQKQMGFAKPAQISFDKLILSDETTILQLLIQLADRDIISMDSLLSWFNILPDIEQSKIKRESKKRGSKLPRKASPFHNPMWDSRLKEQLVLQGIIDPKDAGVNIDGVNSNDPKFKPPIKPGRPLNVVETRKRKPKPATTPRTKTESEYANVMVWANSAYDQIAQIINPKLLERFGKSNFRKLTDEEGRQAEAAKFSVLMAFSPEEYINKDKVIEFFNQNIEVQRDVFDSLYRLTKERVNREPNLAELKQIYLNTYVIDKLYGGSNG